MKQEILSCIVIAAVFMSAFTAVATPVRTVPADYEPVDIGPRLRAREIPINFESRPEDYGLMTLQTATVNTLQIWLVLDDYEGVYFFDLFECRAVGTNAEIWVQVNLSWPTEDPRSYPVVTDDQVNYLLSEFETTIYPTDAGYFGAPAFHDGSLSLLEAWGYFPPGYYYEATGRHVILVSNIRDAHYYDPSYPYYVAGFYSPDLEAYMDRNIISIDAGDWENRVGPDVARPYMYESTLTHEYQHLLHDDYNPLDEDFMNEGCSMYASMLCGYPVDWEAINSFLYTPDNSLIEWGDQGDINILADYGAALLWGTYLTDQFGSDFLSAFVQDGIPGIAGINAELGDRGYTETFDDVFHDWRIANLIHTDTPGAGKYNYVTLDLNSRAAIAARTYNVKKPWVSEVAGSAFGSTTTILGYDTGLTLIGSYGSDYIKFQNLRERLDPLLTFDGDDAALIRSWIRDDVDGDGDLEWYSTTAGSLADLRLSAAVSLPSSPPITLTFDTVYEIEEAWDFGFVQISTDGGSTWTSLANDDTTSAYDPSAHPNIIANLPGFTGSSGGWATEAFDLSAYSGLPVILRFRYMTDWAFESPGWAVDDVAINGGVIDDADTTVLLAPPPPPEVDCMVTVIGVELEKGKVPKYKLVADLSLDDLTETGLTALDPFLEKGYVLLIVSPDHGPFDYTFSVTRGE